ncbi:MMB_0454 family protein [Mycoplasmopsis columboralis]|uniref:Uncharacterized protein n=1 Tax=Mycoplasmopsis columboralis TaxID=171282 RepID=A0A449B7K5_9BACT|nr:hypothetical protein [Mycoplasmopsis columboralis]VEU76567.1 Uncharacterised protein [Mycoplasmopsis columboralis]
MNWINVTYNSNQTYIVKEEAILDVINNVFSELKHLKLVKTPRLSFDENHLDLEIFVDVKIKKNKTKDTYSAVKQLANQIEEAVKILIDKKPKNVQVCLLDII